MDYKKGNMFDPEMKIKCPRWLSYNVSSEKKNVPQVKRIKIVPILKMLETQYPKSTHNCVEVR